MDVEFVGHAKFSPQPARHGDFLIDRSRIGRAPDDIAQLLLEGVPLELRLEFDGANDGVIEVSDQNLSYDSTLRRPMISFMIAWVSHDVIPTITLDRSGCTT